MAFCLLSLEIAGEGSAMVGGLSVLVVEDEALIAMEAAIVLEGAGHEVCGMAADKEGALLMGDRFRPGAAVVDLHLGDGRTGLEVTRELWNRHGTVCLLTTAYPPEVWPKDRLHGAWGLLGKPYVPEQLVAALTHCMALAGGLAAGRAPPAGLKVLG